MAAVATKLINHKLQKYSKHKVADRSDPYKEEIMLPNGKRKKVWREIPDFIPQHDAKILDKVRHRAYKADMGINGSVGWEGIVGFLIPEVGDVLGALYNLLFIVLACNKVEGGLPKTIMTQMMANLTVDFLIGAIPFAGDIFDIFFRANTKNVRLLEKHLRKKYGPSNKKARQSAGLYMLDDDEKTLHEFQTLGASPASHDWNGLNGTSDDDPEVQRAHGSDSRDRPSRSRREERPGRTRGPAVHTTRSTEQHAADAGKPQGYWSKMLLGPRKEGSAGRETGQVRR